MRVCERGRATKPRWGLGHSRTKEVLLPEPARVEVLRVAIFVAATHCCSGPSSLRCSGLYLKAKRERPISETIPQTNKPIRFTYSTVRCSLSETTLLRGLTGGYPTVLTAVAQASEGLRYSTVLNSSDLIGPTAPFDGDAIVLSECSSAVCAKCDLPIAP